MSINIKKIPADQSKPSSIKTKTICNKIKKRKKRISDNKANGFDLGGNTTTLNEILFK